MSNKFYRTCKGEITLNDEGISEAIAKARKDFDNGAIVECYDALTRVRKALDKFIKQELRRALTEQPVE